MYYIYICVCLKISCFAKLSFKIMLLQYMYADVYMHTLQKEPGSLPKTQYEVPGPNDPNCVPDPIGLMGPNRPGPKWTNGPMGVNETRVPMGPNGTRETIICQWRGTDRYLPKSSSDSSSNY